ncbi:CoA transferase [Acrocarpospora catenulata]|uniref:CoA transferase n=1 Tax=Acrocarpospora catenulata TaxID=2836182 RepID=UPI0027DFAB34|nr:CoA transferase [Acrocarpospora catenulata]
MRVLDLSRVIAGPVAGRTLAAHGAEVLRVGSANLPEVPGLVVETGFGKRSCDVDLRTEPERLRELVGAADVVLRAYRPGALETLGFGVEDLVRMRPGIVVVDISAYGVTGQWAGRRGFDSLVQMVSGIANHEGRPHPLPCQALDHATGYLAAFAAVAGLTHRAEQGGSWHADLSLARTAWWLDELGQTAPAEDRQEPQTEDLLDRMDSAFGELTFVRPPGSIEGAEPYWATPPPRPGEHAPVW